jgi:hypothetical protein
MTMKRTFAFPLSILVLILFVSTANAGDPREHDGFFLRLSAGGGWAKTELEDEETGDTLEADAPVAESNFAVGGCVAENLAIHATFYGWLMSDPDVEITGVGSGELNGEFTLSAFGAGITYYIVPVNIYLSASAGAGTISFEGPDFDVESDTGFAGDVTIGKEWWVGDSWGLGFAGAVNLHSIPDGGIDENWKGTSFALRFSATLN